LVIKEEAGLCGVDNPMKEVIGKRGTKWR